MEQASGVRRQASGGLLRPDARRLTPVSVLVFAASFFLFAFFFLQMAILWDADSYYHLAVARHDAQQGIGAPVPWLRFSLLSNGGDKELLFHLFLIPFTTLLDPATGGRIALALLNAALFTAVGSLAVRAIGAWGWAVPLWLWVAAPPFFARVVRLRPELLALLIILVAIPVVERKRWVALGVLAALFAWSYTAWQVFFALCVVWILMESRKVAPILFVAAGTVIGLFIRPHPIANLQIWFAQNVLFFFDKARLDVGNEIGPPSLHTLIESLPWLVAIVVLLAISRRAAEPGLRSPAMIPAALFAVLFLFMARMAIYMFPLVTLAILFAITPRKIPLILGLTFVAALPLAANPTLMQILRGAISEADWQGFGRAVPTGARVAARWGDAEVYVFAAPQGRYLNVLDPIFMALPYPRHYAAQRAIFDGSDPDPAFTAKTVLDSEFLGLDWTDAPHPFVERVKSDPRFRVRYGGYNVLLEIVPSTRFVADVNGRAFFDRSSQICADVGLDVNGSFVLAPYGPAEIVVDGGRQLRSGGVGAILARGIPVDVARRIDIHTCRAGNFNGFYLLRR